MTNSNMIDELIANDPEMLESFINESRECLVAAEKDLQTLLGAPGEPDPECIERAFRAIHSLKSAAGFLGLDPVMNLALHMEKMLDGFRSGDLTPEASRLELLLEGVSLLDTMLKDPLDGKDIDPDPFLVKLAARMTDSHGT